MAEALYVYTSTIGGVKAWTPASSIGGSGGAPPSGTGLAYVSGGAWGTPIAIDRVPIFASAITGTPGSGNFLRGDGSWQTVTGSQWTAVGGTNIYRNSKVHIGGTADPAHTLSITGASNSGLYLKQGGLIDPASMPGSFYNGLIFESSASANQFAIGYSSTDRLGIYRYNAGTTVYKRLLTMTLDGLTGIDCDPSTKFHVFNAGAAIGLIETNDTGSVRWRAYNTTGLIEISMDNAIASIGVSASTVPLVFYFGGSEKVRITQSATYLKNLTTATTANVLYLDTATGLVTYGSLAGVGWQVSGSDLYYSAGNIGIGGATVSYKLYVTAAANSGVYIKQNTQIDPASLSTTIYSGLTLANPATTSAYTMGYGTTDRFLLNYFYAGTTTYSRILTINSSAQMGLGCDPSTKLHLYTATGGGIAQYENSDTGTVTWRAQNSTGLISMSMDNGVGYFGVSSTGVPMVFSVAGSERARITNTELFFSTNIVPAKSTETNVLFWDTSTGKVSYGAPGGWQVSGSNIYYSAGNVNIGGGAIYNNLLNLYKSSGALGISLVSGANYGYLGNDGSYVYLGSDAGTTGVKFKVNRTAPDDSVIIGGDGLLSVGSATMGPYPGSGVTYATWSHKDYTTATGYAFLAGNNGYTFINKRDLAGTYIGFRVNNTDKMVLTNNGEFIVGDTATVGNAKFRVLAGAADSIRTSQGDSYYTLLSTNSTNSKEWGLCQVGTSFRIREAGIGDQLMLFAGGNIAIGGSGSAAGKLHIWQTGGVSNPALVFENTGAMSAKNSAGTLEGFFWPRYSDNIMYMNYGSGGFNLRNSSDYSSLWITSDSTAGGRICIGGTDPNIGGNATSRFTIINDASSSFVLSTTTNARILAINPSSGSVVFYNGQAGSWAANFQLTNTNFYCYGEGTFQYSSDIRFKKSVKPFSGLDLIARINPVSFEWNDLARSFNQAKGTETNYGLIAQELEQVLPQLTGTIYDRYKSISHPEQLIYIALQAIKELKAKVEKLEAAA